MSGYGNYNQALFNLYDSQIRMFLEVKKLHQESKRKAKGLKKLKHIYYILKCNMDIKKLYKWKIKLT